MSASLGTPDGPVTYKDERRYSWPWPLAVAISPILGIVLAQATGLELYTWITPFLWYLFLPIADFVVGRGSRIIPSEAVGSLESDPYYRVLLHASIPLIYASWLIGVWAVSSLHYSWVGYVGVSVCVALTNGLALVVGHELGHKANALDGRLAKIAFAVDAYGHFTPEHNRGHHVGAATPSDTASSRFGESFYRFLLREIPGNAVGGWRHEKLRLERKGKRAWSTENEVLQSFAITVVLYGGALAYCGPSLIPFLLITTFGGWHFMSVFNYLSHYGLLREKLPSGRYERIRLEHSWNSHHLISNAMLYNVQHHSAHHVTPTQRYQAMESGEAPELPGGFPLCFLLAYVPVLWRAVMDPRVLAVCGGDITKVNIDPRKRAAILTSYGVHEDNDGADLKASER